MWGEGVCSMFLLCGSLWVLSSQGMCRRTFGT
ncbi:hypothetical protein Godav_012911 [Gossypium davidsonii]|uniref:Uncharacterized protein n=1 Tax=Gossypium davidsonii TaxID=34287 RepID=A0A7J8RFY4_GOSDV|nr:hypothetical protein [Gossypium davidsonii]